MTETTFKSTPEYLSLAIISGQFGDRLIHLANPGDIRDHDAIRDLLENKIPMLGRMGKTNVCPSAKDLDGHVLASFAHPTPGILFIGNSLNAESFK